MQGVGVISKLEPGADVEFEDEDVLVYLGEQGAIRQPTTFRCCPLGAQLYTCSPLAECQLIELTLALPNDGTGEHEKLCCTGLVVQCCELSNSSPLYRVWVKFLDLSEETIDRLRNMTRSKHFICPFCCNF